MPQLVYLFGGHNYHSMTLATYPDGRSKSWDNMVLYAAHDAARIVQLRNGCSFSGRRICLQIASSCHDMPPIQNPLMACKAALAEMNQSDSNSSGSDSSSSDDSDNSSSRIPESHQCDHRGRCQHFAGERNLEFLIDLYLLADKFIDPLTANLTMDVLTAHLHMNTLGSHMNTLGSMLIEFVYEPTTRDNPLRRLIRD
jgi:hypothetical protein